MRSIGRGLQSFAVRFGRGATTVARHAGSMGILLWRILALVCQRKVPGRALLAAIREMGVESLGLVILVAMLSGVVTSQQGGYQFTGSVPLYVLGSIVASSVILELGPIMTAFVIIGRVGARITAEIGTMKVSEQIDALHSLGRDPVRVLAVPRLLAGMIVMPLLVGIADAVGLFAGMLAAHSTLGLSSSAFLYGARIYFHGWDLAYSLMKGLSFGFIIPLIAVHMGLITTGGAEGVGRSTTASVVFMIIAVMFMDALFPPLLLG